jgi:hypothetical protein
MGSEKYVKKLFGRTDLEDALKRLDKLTHDEARTAIAQNLKATHTVDERMRGVAARVAGVDDRVARVEDTVTAVADGKQKFSVIDTVFTRDVPSRKGRKGNHPTNGQRCRPSQTFVTP